MADEELTLDSVRRALRTLIDWASSTLEEIERQDRAHPGNPISIDELAKWMHEKQYLRDDFATDREFKDFLGRLLKADLAAKERT